MYRVTRAVNTYLMNVERKEWLFICGKCEKIEIEDGFSSRCPFHRKEHHWRLFNWIIYFFQLFDSVFKKKIFFHWNSSLSVLEQTDVREWNLCFLMKSLEEVFMLSRKLLDFLPEFCDFWWCLDWHSVYIKIISWGKLWTLIQSVLLEWIMTLDWLKLVNQSWSTDQCESCISVTIHHSASALSLSCLFILWWWFWVFLRFLQPYVEKLCN